MGWTQETLASKLGVTRSYLSQLESSAARQPGDTLALLLTQLEHGDSVDTALREEPPRYAPSLPHHSGSPLERAVLAEARLELALTQIEGLAATLRAWCDQSRRTK